MRRVFALAVVTFLASCSSPLPSVPPPAPRGDIEAIAKQLQNHWTQCLTQSYNVTRTQTPDKNAAAEMAFQACSSEEEDYASLPSASFIIPHLRAEAKRVLIEEGRIPDVQ